MPNALADLGVRRSVDDVGIGYSSLVYLRSCPVTALEIDRSLGSAMPGLSLAEAQQRFVLVEAALLLVRDEPRVSAGLVELLPGESPRQLMARAVADRSHRPVPCGE